MKVFVYIDRKKAMLAGKNEFGWRGVEIDMGKLSDEEREYLAGRQEARWMKDENGVYLVLAPGDRHCPAIEMGSIAEATEAQVMCCIAEQITKAKVAEAQAKKEADEKSKKEADAREKAIVALLAQPAESLLVNTLVRWHPEIECFHATGSGYHKEYSILRLQKDARLEGKYAEAEQIALDKNKEIVKNIENKIAAWKTRQLEEQKKEVERKAQLRRWVLEKGTENQKKRYEIDLLPASEITDAIRDEAYQELDNFPQYKKLTSSDVCVCEDDYGSENCSICYRVLRCSGATSEEFDVFEKIADVAKKAYPASVVTMMEHVGTGEECGNEIVRKSAKVEIEVGALNFSREYAI